MTATFYVGDAIEVMGKLPENSVDLILTSPPFLALRSYLPSDHPDKALEGGSQATPGAFIDWLVDVVEACDRVLAPHGSLCIELGDTYAGSGGGGGDYYEGGLREGQPGFTGSEAASREALKAANAAHWRQKNPPKGKLANYNDARGNPDGMRDTTFSGGNTRTGGGTGWPLAKSLSLIPELFRLTLVYGTNPLTGRQTDRWRLRNVVRWVRPNPPVGALGDKFRPATSELMVFCKSAKRYFDLDSVRESPKSGPPGVDLGPGPGQTNSAWRGVTDGGGRERILSSHPSGAPPLDWWNIPLLEGEEETRYGPKPKGHRDGESLGNGPKRQAKRELGDAVAGLAGLRRDGMAITERIINPLGSPPLDWWNIPPGGFSGAHYAVFPPELCVKPVKAMCPEKVCNVCGEPSRRLVDVSYTPLENPALNNAEPYAQATMGQNPGAAGMTFGRARRNVETLGFSDCGHDDWRPGVVLDPFVGSGTTLMVATGHGRDAIGIDLDERNFDLALDRVGPFILTKGEAA